MKHPGTVAWRDMMLLLVVMMSLLCTEAARAREVRPLDFDWRFALADPKDAASPSFDDSTWRTLDLPHDWSVEGAYAQTLPGQGGYLPGGIAWYRRTIDLPDNWAGQRVSVEFDAVCMNSDVYVNGVHLGRRPYGYISFGYDLTRHLRPGRNVLAVRVDTCQLPNARWYAGSGIYGHVHLLATNPVHVARWGTAITTPAATAEHFGVNVSTEIANNTQADCDAEVAYEILDPHGIKIAAGETKLPILAGKSATASASLAVDRPALWSPKSPALYTLVTRVRQRDKVLDETRTPFGIRTTRWDADTGFWLNGKNVKLHGFCMHYDAGGALGVAVPDAVNEFRLRQLKSMGCNAVRTGHTPFPPAFYDLCDRLGLMVIDEAFDGWKRKAQYDYGALFFNDWWQRDLGDMIRRDRNHPSVIAWSMGNETGQRDIYHLSDFAHSIDPSRPTTGGQLLEGVDVSGFTGRGEAPGVLDDFHKSHPRQPILLTEETHTYATRGHYRAVTWWRDAGNQKLRQPDVPYATEEVFTGGDEQWVSSYDNALVRMSCRQCTKRTNETPWIAGEFKWAAYDYLGEAQTNGRHWPLRYATMGVLDSACFPKDLYYFYQSQYSTDPMVHLLPHWTLGGMVKPGAIVPVVAYSNCDEVELFQDGRSLGRQKPRPLLDFVWDVPYTPGELKAVAYRAGKVVAEDVVRTAGAPAQLKLTPDHPTLKPDRRDVSLVAVAAEDAAGRPVPTAFDRVDFALLGPARWLGVENGNPTDVSSHKAKRRDLFAGLLRAYVGATADAGDVELVALAVFGQPRFKDSTTVTISPATLPLRGAAAPPPDIYYTLDGSEPTAASPRYEKPFTLDRSATLRILLTRAGQPLLTTDRRYERD